jgi:Tfp pilus assembly protein PilF
MRLFNKYDYSHIAASFIVVFSLLIFGAAFYPTGWNWGFHFLAFYRLEIIIVVPLLMLLFISPAIQKIFIMKISLCHQWFSKQHHIVRVIITLSALCGLVLLFWVFRVKSYFLGDGQLVLRNIQHLESAKSLALEYKREPLIGFCIVILTNFFILLKQSNPGGDAYTWLSIISGTLFVVIAWQLVRYYSEDRIERYMLFFLVITTGASQLFFGYVENYSPSSVVFLLFLLLGTAYLRGTISIVWSMIVFGILFMFHFGTLILLPTFSLLLYNAVKRKQVGELAASLFLTGAVFIALLQFSQYPFELFKDVLSGTGHHIVPFYLPLKSYQAYNFFSLSHFLDVVNFSLLCYPATIILLIVSSIMIRRKQKTLPTETKFVLFAALCGTVFIIILNCEIGMSRDWDVLAPISLGIPIAAIALWNTVECEKKLRYRILIMLCIVSLLHTGIWVGVNADEMKAEKRFIILADNYLWGKDAHLNAYEELAVYYRERNDYKKAIQYYQKYIALDSTNRRLWGNLADAYELGGQKKNAIEVYKNMMQSGMGNYQILVNLGILLADEQNFLEALVLFRQAEEYAPEDSKVKYNIGITMMESEQAYIKELPYFLSAIQLDSTFTQAYYRAAQCYYMLGDSLKANQLMIQSQKFSQ